MMATSKRQARTRTLLLGVGGALALFLLSALLRAQTPVGGEVFSDIEITGEGEQTLIDVRFSFVLRYVTHFPKGKGTVLVVKLDPVLVGTADAAAVTKRETLPLPPGPKAGLTEVTYEGSEGGPFLWLYFEDPVQFDVRPAPDFRGIQVRVQPAPAPEDRLEPAESPRP